MRYKINYQLLCVVIILITLSACNAGLNQANLPAKSLSLPKAAIQSNLQQLPYTMGGTYDSTTGYPTATTTCLNAGQAGSYSIIDPSATIDFSEQQSLQEVLHALGMDVAVTVGWGPFAVTSTYNYVKSTQDDAYTLNINYIYQYTGKLLFNKNVNLQGNSALTPEALAVIGESAGAFRTMCGDRFVEQMDASASVLIHLQLKFNSTEEKNYFDSTLKKITGLDNVLNIIESNPKNINFSLSASGVQVGGNPSLLNNIFTTAGGKIDPSTGNATLECGTSAKIGPQCVQLVNQVLTYSASIKSQLDPQNLNDFYFSNPISATWGSIGITPGDVNPDPNSLNAMRQITNLYNSDQAAALFINNYQNMLQAESLLSPTMNADLTNLTSLYQNILAIYTSPDLNIMNCYNGFVSTNCVNIYNTIASERQQIIAADPELFNLLSYLENNRYVISLLLGSSEFNKADCGLYPITSSINSLFLINCNGQVSGSFNPKSATSITLGTPATALQVNNLNYTYVNESRDLFSYKIDGQLQQNGADPNVYNGNADIFINESNSFPNSRILLVRRFWY